MERRINSILKERQQEGLLRRLATVSPLGSGKIRVGGRKYINLSSNDYLGLSSHPELARAALAALSPVVGSSASRLMSGSTRLHHVLEDRIAGFKGKEAALVFNSGYQANVGIISALCGKDDCIFSDRLNHASIVDGIRLSGARLFRFRHNDTDHLEELLCRERNRHRGALILTETVFSMDGDIAPVGRISQLKKKHNCMFMVDEAHATGIFGACGGGVLEAEGVTGGADIIMGTFSKALGGFGSYAATSRTLRDYLVNTCRSFIYSTSLPPSIIAADLAALELIKREPHRRETLLSNACYFRAGLKKKGFHVRGDSQIVPIIVGENKEAVRVSEFLKGKGYWVTPVRPPTVPHGQARLRISLTFDHTPGGLEKFIKDISGYGQKNH
ncbi:MAG: 8-amino-7-oxononanoate synthase [Candidatus Makaraimicrobium thalassicum]|nr:MAG: 8-amino-7-oxononanoate synthase [Candidatus Omnitrophota bacterium]